MAAASVNALDLARLRVVGVVELPQHEGVLADFLHEGLRLPEHSFEALARRRQLQPGAESLPTNEFRSVICYGSLSGCCG